MTFEEIKNKYLTPDGNYIKKMSSEIDLKKDDLYDILKWWSKITTKDTIGDLTTMNRNQKLIIFKIGSSSYYINADTKKIGVNQFLLNKDNPWKIIFNENGVKNKVTNGLDENPISYFYMYKL